MGNTRSDADNQTQSSSDSESSLPPLGQDPFSDIVRLSGTRAVRTIFDVGANVGQTASALSAMFPESTIYSFEPFAEAFAKLCSVAQERPNILPFEFALGDQDGGGVLFLNQNSTTNSLLQNSDSLVRFVRKPTSVTPIGKSAINIFRLDTFCDQNEISSIDVLKIDTQGFELKVLKGAGQLLESKRIRFVYLEVLFVPLYEQQAEFHEVHRVLAMCGYRFVNLYGLMRDDRGLLKWGNALYMADPSTEDNVI